MAACFICKQTTTGCNSLCAESASLITLLEEVTRRKLDQKDSDKICTHCLDLLIELNDCHKRFTEISDKFCSYLVQRSAAPVSTAENEFPIDLLPATALELKCVSADTLTNYKCDICCKIFYSKYGFTRHLKRLHSDCANKNASDKQTDKSNNICTKEKKNISKSLKTYKCIQCPKTFKTSGELKAHLNSHNSAKPFICEVCGRAYRNKSALDVHVGMHNGVYPFMCVYCKKSFTQKGALQRHLHIHTGETPYQCDLCGKRFIHHTSFKIHSLSHSGQKLYKCNICGLALLSTSHLKRHTRVHTGEKKYICGTCGRRFAERYNLISHQKLHEVPNSNSRYEKISCRKRVSPQEHIETCRTQLPEGQMSIIN